MVWIYHPILFGLITFLGAVELGLTAYERHKFSYYNFGDSGTTKRLDFLLFDAIWTFVFGLAYLIFAHTGDFGALASFASHAGWLLLTFLLWLVGAALWSSSLHTFGCGFWYNQCHITHAIEGIAWAEMVICLIALLAVCLHIGGKRENARKGIYDV